MNMTFMTQRASARNGGAMTPDLQTIACALGGEISGNCVRAPGPGHSRKDRSLAIEIKDDTLLVNTFSPRDDQRACFDYVVKQLGLDMRTNGKGAPGAEQFSKKKIVAEYTYTDQHGGPLYQVLRYEPKDFRQRRSDGNGGWIWTRGEHTVLYRWPELVRYPHGRPMLTVLGGLAEFERELIRARTDDGRKRAQARGVRFGRPLKLTAHQRREAIQRLAEGAVQADLARTYGVSQATISRLAAPSPFEHGAVAAL